MSLRAERSSPLLQRGDCFAKNARNDIKTEEEWLTKVNLKDCIAKRNPRSR
jgi:hypothetical protein